MAKYIDRDSLIEWLKRIRLIDLSDGLGICRVIMEDDFKKAITNMPETFIMDVAPEVRCKDCKHSWLDISGRCCSYVVCVDSTVPDDFYCAYAIRKEGE